MRPRGSLQCPARDRDREPPESRGGEIRERMTGQASRRGTNSCGCPKNGEWRKQEP